MSNSQTRPEPSKLTPQELADKCLELLIDVIDASKTDNPEDNWAKEAKELGKELHKEAPTEYDSLCIALKTSDIKSKLPELWEQVIEPAIKIANKKGAIYKAPEDPAYIIIGKHKITGLYNAHYHAIGLGINYMDPRESLDEIIATVSHEWGHAYQLLQTRVDNGLIGEEELLKQHPENSTKPFAPYIQIYKYRNSHEIEYISDRYALARAGLADFLNDIILEKKCYKYPDRKCSHPNVRRRIHRLLSEMLGNEIFGMNGIFNMYPSYDKNTFFPKHAINSTPNIQKELRKKIGYDRVMLDSTIYSVTEDGKLVKNFYSLDLKINKKANELIKKLDPLVESGLNLAKKAQWLEMVDKEVAEFREKNKPEFVDGKDVPLGGWESRITLESCSSNNNRGRK